MKMPILSYLYNCFSFQRFFQTIFGCGKKSQYFRCIFNNYCLWLWQMLSAVFSAAWPFSKNSSIHDVFHRKCGPPNQTIQIAYMRKRFSMVNLPYLRRFFHIHCPLTAVETMAKFLQAAKSAAAPFFRQNPFSPVRASVLPAPDFSPTFLYHADYKPASNSAPAQSLEIAGKLQQKRLAMPVFAW